MKAARPADPGIDAKLSTLIVSGLDGKPVPLARKADAIEIDYEKAPQPGEDVPAFLGKGSFGHVWRYKRMTPSPTIPMGQCMAVKEMNKSLITKSERMLRLTMVEMSVLRGFNHPNIITLYEVVHTQSRLYIVMEIVSGGDLYAFIHKHRPVCPDEAGVIVKQILEGLKYIHGRDVVHRDIKPENILIDVDTRHIKIIDFGLAKYCREGGGGGPQDFTKEPSPITSYHVPSPTIVPTPDVGTALYCSLEQVCGALGSDWTTTKSNLKKVDIYATGVIAYTMLVGSLPFIVPSHRPGGQEIPKAQQLRELKRKIAKGVQFPARCAGLPISCKMMVQFGLMHVDTQERKSAKEALEMEWMQSVQVPESALPQNGGIVVIEKAATTIQMCGPPGPGKRKKGRSCTPPSGKASPSPAACQSPPVAELSDVSEAPTAKVGKIECEEDGEEEAGDPGLADPEEFKDDWDLLLAGPRADDDDQNFTKSDGDVEMGTEA